MKHLLLGICCFAFTSNLSAQKVDTLLRETWKDIAWVNNQRTITAYNTACNIASTLEQFWDVRSGIWVNDKLTTYTYTGNIVLSSLAQIWNNGTSTWENSSRITYTYNVSSKLASILDETWQSNAWQNFSRQTYSYDGNGFLAVNLSETWDITSGWVYSMATTNTNNSDGTISQTVSQIWNTFAFGFDNSSRGTFSYNLDKTVSQEVWEYWNISLGVWENNSKYTYTYNVSAKVLTQLRELWQTNQWVNYFFITKTYDGSDYLINEFLQAWNNGTNSWDNNFNIIHANNSDGTIHQIVYQPWVPGISSWQNDTRQTYSYTNTCNTLPLTLLNLTATRNNHAVLVNWQTAGEINTSYFTVQMSLDAASFTKIGEVPAKGSSLRENDYSFTDNTTGVRPGKIYYRLAMVDKDKKCVYSKVVSVTVPGSRDYFTIKPNPAKNFFIIIHEASTYVENSVVAVSDFAGHVVIKHNVTSAGEQKVNISALAKGIYMVSISTGGEVKTQKLLVE